MLNPSGLVLAGILRGGTVWKNVRLADEAGSADQEAVEL